MSETVWPKRVPVLTDEQEAIRDDFVRHWHEVLPDRFSLIERFNHGYAARSSRPGARTLEIGAGLGEQLAFERGGPDDYCALELREEMSDGIRSRHPGVEVVTGDVQARLPFDDNSFDRVLAVHVLEHLPDLPAALGEVARILRPDGTFEVVIPCEGGAAYGLARRVSAQRIFEKRYGQSYRWFIKSEHLNVPAEIIPELERHFVIGRRRFFPFLVPVVTVNLVIGLTLTPRG